MKTLLLVTSIIFGSIVHGLQAQATLYPASANVIDLTKDPYNADNTGTEDITQKLRDAFIDHNDSHTIIYLPEGTYRVTDTITWGSPAGCNEGTTYTCHRYTVLAGAGMDKTKIVLDDNSLPFADANTPQVLIWTQTSAAMSFENSVRNLTIETGSGNPGVHALGFEANNQGGIYNVRIKSNDGSGLTGLHLGTGDQAGPMLVKNLIVEGFDIGIRTFANQNSIYFEHIQLYEQNVYGIFNRQQMISIKDLYSYNEVPVIYNQGDGGSMVSLINSNLEGFGDAINNKGFLNFNRREIFLRNVNVSGYQFALQQLQNGFSLGTIPTGYIDEYTTHPPKRICDNDLKSLNLAIKETPVIKYEDTSSWVSISSFGAELDNGFAGKGSSQDDTQALQAALNSGASTVLVPGPQEPFPRRFIVYDTITIPPSVKYFIGAKGLLSGSFVIKILPGTDTLFIEDFAQLQQIYHASQRVLVLKKAGIKRYKSMDNGLSGDVFIEDVVGGPYNFKNQNVWARQFNTEIDSLCVTNDGGQLWVFGMKTEKKGTAIRTTNGGKTEVLGALFYGTKAEETIPKPIFIVEESAFSISTFKELGYINDYWDIKVRETRNGVTNDYTQGNTAIRTDLFVAYPSPASSNQAPTVNAGEDIIIDVTQSFTNLQGISNDDALPSGNCFASYNWRQLSGPSTLEIVEPGSLNSEIQFDESGVYHLELTADDGDLTDKDTVMISVYDNAISTADHDGDGNPSGNGADANLRGWSNADKNYGGDFSFGPRHYNQFPAKSILRIDLSALPTTPLESCRLEFEIATENSGLIEDWEYNIFGLKDEAAGASWIEGTLMGAIATASEVTYLNAPGFSTSSGGAYVSSEPGSGGVDHSNAVFLGIIKTRKGQREKVSFSSAELTSFMHETQAESATFLITRKTFALNTIVFASKEHPTYQAPTLHLDHCPEDATVYVDASAQGTQRGDQWSNAYPSLQDFLDSPCLSAVDTVKIADGYYSIVPNETDQFVEINHELVLMGGYASGGGERNPEAFPVVITKSNAGDMPLLNVPLLRIVGPDGKLTLLGVRTE